MFPFIVEKTTALSFEDSILEVEVGMEAELEQPSDGGQADLIESFSKPFPLRELDKPATSGEIDHYG